ncbi:PIN domain-containing protein [Roseofilum sp. BLCC_M91]|uniref:PIN domain-containing protein n=1 Tax=Roseofilum halophilum BLCC-M91 TaxID=3022259 RepID=A0ABT7BFK6_9CYAN|nr:PIN domain-containing protein [Roseofilum halophilum]MDJ1177958.1 PIN domain-containing protein [Roseofilum halophilum BLCC-M91]
MTAMQVCPVNKDTLERAMTLNYKDFEDAIQLVCALEQNVNMIVTRNLDDFSDADMKIISPVELIAILEG